MARGKYEEAHLTARQRAEREHLPAGIGLENSPLFDLPNAPWDLLPHLIRYYYVASHLIDNVIAAYPPPGTVRFLDVGCGMGEMRSLLYSYRFPKGYSKQYVGVDGDPIKLALARSFSPSGDFRELLLPDGLATVEEKFNGIICTEVYEHLEESAGLETLHLLHKMMLPGGIAVFTLPSPSHSRYRENPLHLNEQTPQEFLAASKKAGWTVRRWFWLRIPNLQSLGSAIPRVIQRLVSAPMLTAKPENLQGNNSLYILEA